MRILYLLYPLFFFINIPSVNGFIQKTNQMRMNKNNTRLLSNTQYDNKIIKKFRDVSKLTRSVNIIPTLLLSFSGGWIMNPSTSNLIHSTPFIVSNINAVLIMSLSMILNDLFDIEVDKLNNPSRPLITGEISKIEAISLSGLLFLIIEYRFDCIESTNKNELIKLSNKQKKTMLRLQISLMMINEIHVQILTF